VARRPEVVGGSAGGRGVASRFGGGGTRAQPPSVYRRRRLGAVLVVATVALGARALALGLAGAPVPSLPRGATSALAGLPVPSYAQPVAVRTYRVAPGDTLWAIARRLEPNGDVRNLVDELASARHGRPVRPGDVITLP